MATVTDGLMLAHVPAVARVENRPQRMIQQWLGSGTFSPRIDGASNSIILEQVDWNGLANAMASDIDRLSKAGRETLQITSCVSGMPKASAWMLIQSYYSAFYFSQALMRLCGVVPSYYLPGDLSRLSQILDTYQVPSPFPLKGQLLLRLDSATRTVIIEKGSGGASHEAAWKELGKLLDSIVAMLPTSTLSQADQIDITDDVERLKGAISLSGNVSKLSTIRNNVQYKQELGGWHPYTRAINSDDLKRRIGLALNTDRSLSQFETNHHTGSVRFLECCLCVCAAARSFLINLEALYGAGFIRSGYCKLEAQYASANAA